MNGESTASPFTPHPSRPRIYVFFGLIATGKSTLARAWADRYDLAYYNSDVVRKELAGLEPTARQQEAQDSGIYRPEFSRRTYQVLLDRAAAAVQAGSSVVLDGSYQRRDERQRLRELARAHDCPVYFIFCTSPEPVLRERLAQRAGDPAAVSDGRWEIYLQQKERFEPPTELTARELVTFEVLGPVEQLINSLAAAIRLLQADSTLEE